MKKVSLKGFTLTELLAVMVILGTIMILAIPLFRGYTEKAKYSEAVRLIDPYKKAVTWCIVTGGTKVGCDSATNNIPHTYSSDTGLVQSIIVKDGTITLVPNKQDGILTTDTYVLTPSLRNGRISWSTAGGSVVRGLTN